MEYKSEVYEAMHEDAMAGFGIEEAMMMGQVTACYSL